MRMRQYRSDAYFVRQTLSGRREAYSELVHRYFRPATAFAYSRVQTLSDAEEVVQESLVCAFEGLDTLRDPGKFGTWLLGIVRNCAGRERARHRNEASHQERADLPQCAEAHDFAREELFALVRSEVDALPGVQREIVLLRYFSGWNAREIAEKLECSPAAVRKQLERARKHLGARLLEQLSDRRVDHTRATKKVIAMVAATNAGWIARASASPLASTLSATPLLTSAISKFALIALVAASLVWMAIPRGSVNSEADTRVIAADTPPAEDPVAIARLAPAPLEGPPSAAAIAPAGTPEPPAAPAREYSLGGRVVDERGATVPNAEVAFQLVDGGPRFWPSYDGPRPALHTERARTDDAGVFRFGVPEGLASDSVAQFRITAASGAAELRMLMTGISHLDYQGDFILHATERFSATIVAADGNPIAGAWLQPIEYEPRGASRGWVDGHGHAFESGKDGLAAAGLYEGRWKFFASARGFAARETEFLETGRSDAVIALEPGWSLRGSVRVDESTVPPPLWLLSGKQYEEVHRAAIDPVTREYAFDSLRPGTYYLWTDDPELVVTKPDRAIEILATSPVTTRDLSLRRGGSIEGRLCDAATGDGIAGVRVAAGYLDAPELPNINLPPRAAITDENGRFDVTGLGDGNYRLFYSKHPLVPPPSFQRDRPKDPIPIAAGRTAAIGDWRIDRRIRLTGTVVDQGGASVRGAQVQVLPRGEGKIQDAFLDFMGGLVAYPAGDGGEFTVYFPMQASDVYVRAVAPGLVSREAGPLTVGLNTPPVGLVLEPAGSIAGVLTDRAGRPAGGRSLSITGKASGPVHRLTWGGQESGTYLSPALSSERSGHFYYGMLVTDTYTLGSQENPGAVSFTLEAGEQKTGVEVSLYPGVSKLVRGRVTRRGEPVPGARVVIGRDQTEADSAGDFAVAAFDPESVDASLNSSSTRDGIEIDRSLRLEKGAAALSANPLAFEFARGPASVGGRVYRNGEPWRRVHLSLSVAWIDGATETISVTTDDRGAYYVDGLPEGSQAITANPLYTTVAGSNQTAQLTLRRGFHEGVDLHFRTAQLRADLSGIAAGETGIVRVIPGSTIVSELSVELIEEMRRASVAEEVIERDGSLAIEFFDEGRYILYVAAYDKTAGSVAAALPTIRYHAVPIEIVGGRLTRVAVDLARGAGTPEISPLP